MLELLLNLVTARIEALLAEKFLNVCVKKWVHPRFDTFHQLLIIVGAMWSNPVLQVGNQVAVARNEIRAGR
jgi:hypothetical protein